MTTQPYAGDSERKRINRAIVWSSLLYGCTFHGAPLGKNYLDHRPTILCLLGEGEDVALLQRIGVDLSLVTAVDLDPDVCDRARERFRGTGLRVEQGNVADFDADVVYLDFCGVWGPTTRAITRKHARRTERLALTVAYGRDKVRTPPRRYPADVPPKDPALRRGYVIARELDWWTPDTVTRYTGHGMPMLTVCYQPRMNRNSDSLGHPRRSDCVGWGQDRPRLLTGFRGYEDETGSFDPPSPLWVENRRPSYIDLNKYDSACEICNERKPEVRRLLVGVSDDEWEARKVALRAAEDAREAKLRDTPEWRFDNAVFLCERARASEAHWKAAKRPGTVRKRREAHEADAAALVAALALLPLGDRSRVYLQADENKRRAREERARAYAEAERRKADQAAQDAKLARRKRAAEAREARDLAAAKRASEKSVNAARRARVRKAGAAAPWEEL
jgi:hypothetical protein